MEEPALYQRVNVEGTVNLLEAARQNGVKKITIASSSSVYGVNSKSPFSETDPIPGPSNLTYANALRFDRVVEARAEWEARKRRLSERNRVRCKPELEGRCWDEAELKSRSLAWWSRRTSR